MGSIFLHLQSLSNCCVALHSSLASVNLSLHIIDMELINPIILQHSQSTLARLFKYVAFSTLQEHQSRDIIPMSFRQISHQLLRISLFLFHLCLKQSRNLCPSKTNIISLQPSLNNLLGVINSRNQSSQIAQLLH